MKRSNPLATALIIILIEILVLISIKAFAQNQISFAVLHDVKLGLGMDAEHGNDKYTSDFIFNMNWEGNQFEYYYFAIQSQYEIANLYGGKYSRYSVHGMWNFNRLIIDDLTVSPGVGIGMINRSFGEGYGSYSGTLDISYPIFKDVEVIVKNEWVRRSDLITPKLGYNLALGLKYTPFKL